MTKNASFSLSSAHFHFSSVFTSKSIYIPPPHSFLSPLFHHRTVPIGSLLFNLTLQPYSSTLLFNLTLQRISQSRSALVEPTPLHQQLLLSVNKPPNYAMSYNFSRRNLAASWYPSIKRGVAAGEICISSLDYDLGFHTCSIL
jgi:hypothetical protein